MYVFVSPFHTAVSFPFECVHMVLEQEKYLSVSYMYVYYAHLRLLKKKFYCLPPIK
jgi:hypothetical protein